MCGNQFVSKKPLESSMIIITTGEEEEEGEWAATTTLSVNFNQKVFFVRGETRERERESVCVVTVFH